MERRRFILLGLVAAMGGIGGPIRAAAEVGRLAPDFTLPLLDGGSLTLGGLRGKPVVVNFWHSG